MSGYRSGSHEFEKERAFVEAAKQVQDMNRTLAMFRPNDNSDSGTFQHMATEDISQEDNEMYSKRPDGRFLLTVIHDLYHNIQ